MKETLLRSQAMAANSSLERDIQTVSEPERQLIVALLEALKATRRDPDRHQFLQGLIEVGVKASQHIHLSPAGRARKSDFEQMVEGLTLPEVLKALAPNDPLAAARLKGLQVKHELLYGEGAPLNSEAVAQLLHLSRQAVDKRRQKGQLLGLSLGRRGYFYPVWQFRDGQTLPGLDRVLAALNEYSAWTQAMFLCSGDVRLESKTPIERLRAGHIEAVVRAAECYGTQGAA